MRGNFLITPVVSSNYAEWWKLILCGGESFRFYYLLKFEMKIATINDDLSSTAAESKIYEETSEKVFQLKRGEHFMKMDKIKIEFLLLQNDSLEGFARQNCRISIVFVSRLGVLR